MPEGWLSYHLLSFNVFQPREGSSLSERYENSFRRQKIHLKSTASVVGAKSLEAAKHDLNYAARRLGELRLISPTKVRTELQNIVATTDLANVRQSSIVWLKK